MAGAVAIVVLILMDTADGVVARRRGEETLLGSALDIAADRAVEVVLWFVYADRGVVSVVIPILVATRGVVVDTIRNTALRYGLSAHHMMRTSLGRWLVASPFMRTGYALSKVVAFVLLGFSLGLEGHPARQVVYPIAQGFAWLALSLCLVRGLPVLLEAPRTFRELERSGPGEYGAREER